MTTKHPRVIKGVTEPISIQELLKGLLYGARLHSNALAARENIPLSALMTVARMSSGEDVVFGPSEVDAKLHLLLEGYLEKNPDALKANFGFDYKIFDMRHDPPLEVDKGMPKTRVASMPMGKG